MPELVDLTSGEGWMRWTIRAAIVCILLRWIARWRNTARAETPSAAECWLWALGLVFYLVHVLLAFHVVHHWSHQDAWQRTAEQTARLTGIRRGEGIWANHLFTIIWTADVIRLIRARVARKPTSRWLDRASFVVFAFMVFHATVVFGPDHYRWLAIPVLLMLFLVWRRRPMGPEGGHDPSLSS